MWVGQATLFFYQMHTDKSSILEYTSFDTVLFSFNSKLYLIHILPQPKRLGAYRFGVSVRNRFFSRLDQIGQIPPPGILKKLAKNVQKQRFFSPQPTILAEGYCYHPFRLSVCPSVRLLTFEMQLFVRGILVWSLCPRVLILHTVKEYILQMCNVDVLVWSTKIVESTGVWT